VVDESWEQVTAESQECVTGMVDESWGQGMGR
jgi:hypothetical protein